jgi:hypothetical protein
MTYNTEYSREWTVQLLTRESERRFRPTADRRGVFDTVLNVMVERNQYSQDVAYICRRLNAGLSYVPGGHIGPPKVYPPFAQGEDS